MKSFGYAIIAKKNENVNYTSKRCVVRV